MSDAHSRERFSLKFGTRIWTTVLCHQALCLSLWAKLLIVACLLTPKMERKNKLDRLASAFTDSWVAVTSARVRPAPWTPRWLPGLRSALLATPCSAPSWEKGNRERKINQNTQNVSKMYNYNPGQWAYNFMGLDNYLDNFSFIMFVQTGDLRRFNFLYEYTDRRTDRQT